MAKRKKSQDLFDEDSKECQAKEFLRERGYGVFKIGEFENREEAELIKKLQSVGYKVEHLRDSLVKVDTKQISSVDDIVVYFHEMLRRHSKIYFDRDKLQNKDHRSVDRSIINHLINWRVEAGDVSIQEAISELFIMIDILFDKAKLWEINIKSIGILSITKNKAFVLSLFREVRLKQDQALIFQIDQQIDQQNKDSYLELLDQYKENMVNTTNILPKKYRKIKL